MRHELIQYFNALSYAFLKRKEQKLSRRIRNKNKNSGNHLCARSKLVTSFLDSGIFRDTKEKTYLCGLKIEPI